MSVRRQRHHALVPSRPSVLSLYSGAGGLDLGFARAGFDLVWANDHDKHAVATYKQNIGDHAVWGDVLHTPLPDLRPDVVIGGPPCQGFSVIGRMREGDPRSQHVFHFLDVVRRLEPQAFVMENVKALGASPRWAPLREELARRAHAAGYATRLMILNACHYGVPQARERMFLIGLRGEQCPMVPAPTTADAPPTVREALALLPAFGQPGNDTVTGARVVPSREPVMRPTAHNWVKLAHRDGITPTTPAPPAPAPAPPTPPSSSPTPSAGGDKNCSDFSTHHQAQQYFDQNGGSPTNDVDGLDRNSDGVACSSLP